MDYSELTPNPIIFFASFLIFLSYIYSKLQPSYRFRNNSIPLIIFLRSVEKEHYHEGYALQEHYLPNGPQVYKTHAQERPPFFFEEAYNQNFARPQFSQNIQPTKDFGNNFVQYKPYQNGQQKIDESISYDEGWPSREPDLHFPDVSAIHGISKTREAVLSPNNSSFDYPFVENKNVMKDEFNIPESKSSMSLEIPAKELKDSEKNQRSPLRAPNPRRGPVYDSSDTDTEQRPRKQNGYAENVNEDAMEIVCEKGVPHEKRKYEDYKNKGKINA